MRHRHICIVYLELNQILKISYDFYVWFHVLYALSYHVYIPPRKNINDVATE